VGLVRNACRWLWGRGDRAYVLARVVLTLPVKQPLWLAPRVAALEPEYHHSPHWWMVRQPKIRA